VPLTKLQSHVLRVLAAERSPDSYIAGGVAINREGPRFSNDIDIFQDTEHRLEAAAQDAGRFISLIPSDAVGVVFWREEKPSSPSPTH
jgi:hypothetical protein